MIAVVVQQRMAFVLNVGADATSNDSSGKMLCRIRKRAYAMCSRRSDDGGCAAIGHAWRRILCRTMRRSVFSVFVVELLLRFTKKNGIFW